MEIQSALIEVFIQEIGLQKGSSISILAGMSFAKHELHTINREHVRN